MKKVLRYTHGDETLTIVAAEGKSGFNVKASVKKGKGAGQPKAVTGGRAKFQTFDEAVAAVVKLGKESEKRGWAPMAVSVKNAFDAIPAPGETVFGGPGKAPKGKKGKKNTDKQ